MRAAQEIFQYNLIGKGQLSLTEISHKKKVEFQKEYILSSLMDFFLSLHSIPLFLGLPRVMWGTQG